MRPVRLEVQGFGAFRDATVVDLSDAELFAIVGATGHGKSTLIDAICFALYGKVPRHGERDLAPVITLGANEAKVRFTFAVAGEEYTLTRVVRRGKTAGATTRALRLERVGEDGTTEALAGSAAEVEPWLQRLVGLDFDQFTKCVVLPQGRFAAFLHARPGERTAILTALLDLGRYDRMATAARERGREHAGARNVLEGERARLSTVDDAAVAALIARVDALTALLADVEAAGPPEAALARAIDDATAVAARARRAIDAIDEVAIPSGLTKFATQLRAATTRIDAAHEQVDAAEAELRAAEAALAELPPLDELTAIVAAGTELGAVTERVAETESDVADRTTTAESAHSAREQAEQELEAAEAAFDTVQRAHAHHELRAALALGEPCPVCERPVTDLPKPTRGDPLARARKERDAARARVKAAERDARGALDGLQAAHATLAALRDRADELAARLAGADVEAAARDADRARAAHAAVAAARTRATRQRAELTEATKALARFDAAHRRGEAQLQGQRDSLVSAGLEPPPLAGGDLIERWRALVGWCADARPEHEKRAAEHADLARARRAERDALVGELSHRARGLDATPPGPLLADVTRAVHAAAADARHARTDAERQQARRRALDVEIASARDAEAVATTLGRLLDKAHFGQWLVDEALQGLVGSASALLEQLSSGQYGLRIADDGELLVVDHVNADETRSVRSLSGGETFQASLALALALADRVSELAAAGAAKLESIFLDEGFGALDPESLDVVAATIEALGHGDRVVGVVTHVAELAERMPTRLRVRKVGRSATVVREDA